MIIILNINNMKQSFSFNFVRPVGLIIIHKRNEPSKIWLEVKRLESRKNLRVLLCF
jgi:hypothetical protein